jgi:hypothetical protein
MVGCNPVSRQLVLILIDFKTDIGSWDRPRGLLNTEVVQWLGHKMIRVRVLAGVFGFHFSPPGRKTSLQPIQCVPEVSGIGLKTIGACHHMAKTLAADKNVNSDAHYDFHALVSIFVQ